MNTAVQNFPYPSRDSNGKSKTQLGKTWRTMRKAITVAENPTKTLNCFSELLEADRSKETLAIVTNTLTSPKSPNRIGINVPFGRTPEESFDEGKKL